jgi:putative DNA primase/helicase
LTNKAVAFGIPICQCFPDEPEDLMLSNRHQRGNPKEGIAGLQGVRFVAGSEIQDDRHLNTSLVKDLTGQDSVKARKLYSHEFEFTPICKLWLYGNHKPVIKDTTLSRDFPYQL